MTVFCQRDDCGKQLYRKHDETLWNWNRRNYCDKKCAAIVSNRNRQGIKKPRLNKSIEPLVIDNAIIGITYIPGSPEFIKLAKLYA